MFVISHSYNSLPNESYQGFDKLVNKLSENGHGHPHTVDDDMCDPQAHEHDSKVENVPHCLGYVKDPVAKPES